MNIKAINFIDTHCAGPLREARMQSLTELLEEVRAEQRQKFIDELSLYLIDIHNGVTAEDAKMVGHFLNATGESDE